MVRRGIQLQSRDIAFLADLFDSGLMTARHASDLHFEGHLDAARKRLQRLKTSGLISTYPRPLDRPAAYFVTASAVALLVREGMVLAQTGRRRQLSESMIEHELAVMDVKAAFSVALRTHVAMHLTEFTVSPNATAFNVFHPATKEKVHVVPDAYMVIREREAGEREHRFFVEVDRSTEVLEILTKRVLCYRQFYCRGGFAKRFSLPADKYRQLPFRVLIVCKSRLRRNSLAERLRATNPPIRNFVCLATLEDVERDPLGAIWITPAKFQSESRLMDPPVLRAA